LLSSAQFRVHAMCAKARSRWRRDTHWADRWDSRNGLLPTALADGSWHTGRHYVSYRTSKDLAQMSSWDYTIQWEAGMSRRLDLTGMRVLVQRWSASTLAVSHRTGQARDAANQTRHVGSPPRPSLRALFSCAPRNTTRSAHVALARKVPFTAGAIRGAAE
jgi:hypothetical protein